MDLDIIDLTVCIVRPDSTCEWLSVEESTLKSTAVSCPQPSTILISMMPYIASVRSMRVLVPTRIVSGLRTPHTKTGLFCYQVH